MMPTPEPLDIETARVEALARYDILDTLPEEAFDEVSQLAAQVCGMPIALISFVTSDRVWFKSKIGVAVDEVPLDIAFCTHTIRGEGLLEVPDALEDERFAATPLVAGPPHYRFYAGLPLKSSDGFNVGTLCVMDQVPHELTGAQRRALSSLARGLERQLELRVTTKELSLKNRDLAALQRELEARLTNTLDAITDGFWDWNILTGEVFYSPRWAALLGYKWKEVPQRVEFFLSVIHPEDVEALNKAVAEHLAGHSLTTELPVRLRRKTGEYLLVNDQGRVVARDSEGRPLRMVGTITDITERASAAEELRATAERLRLATSAAEIGIWDFLIDENLLIWDEGMFRLYRAEPGKFLGRIESWIACLHPDDTERVVREMQAVLAGEGLNTQFRIVWPDGEIRYLEASVLVLSRPGGLGRRMIGSNRDITERVRAEAEVRAREAQLRESQHVLEEAQRVARLGSWEGDPVSGRMTWSKEMFRILELEPDSCAPSFELLSLRTHPEDEGLLRKAREDADLRGEGINVEHRLLMPDGTTKFVWVRGSAISDRDGTRRLRGTVQDVTERKQLEARLSQSSRMESVGRLAGGVAHDFNNLLTVINGYGKILYDKLGENEPYRGYLAMILQAGGQAAGLTKQLLAFSRNQRLEPKVIDLNDVLLRLHPMLVSLVPENIALHLNPSSNPALVNADPHQMEQVVLNLVGNARDAMPRGGSMNIAVSSARNPRVGVSRVELVVSDTGIGMEAETVKNIFDPFFTTKEVGKGTGLGLAMVHGIVTQIGGQIAVESRPGQGTTFRISLPQSVDAAGQSVEPHSSGARRGGKGVLVVEDRPDVRDYVALALETEGYRVVKASCGAEAVALWPGVATSVDLVLTDVVMPGMNGRELVYQLRRLRPEARVLYMSGYPDDITNFEEESSDGDLFIAKPFTPQQLAAKVAEALII